MAMTPSCQGMLTDEQEKARDLRLALFGDNYLIAKQQSKFDSQMRFTSTAMTASSVERSGHLAMTATIAQDKEISIDNHTLLAQTGGLVSTFMIISRRQSNKSKPLKRLHKQKMGRSQYFFQSQYLHNQMIFRSQHSS